MFKALSHSPNKHQGHQVRLDVYRKVPDPVDGVFQFQSKYSGYLRNENGEWVETNRFQVGYTLWGDRGPVCILLHGVPTNRRAKYPVQELLSPFCRTVSFDMLGMGGSETSKPALYGKSQGASIYDGKPDDPSAWDWVNDCDYIHSMMQKLFPGERYFFQADDWGGGILSHYMAMYPDECLGAILVDPIAFDGYPVSEIQAFGRAAMIPREDKIAEGKVVMEDATYKTLLGTADQTMVQIFKTMVFDPNKYNQYVLRDIKCGYVDVDYERSRSRQGEDANSLTLRLKYDSMRVLSERASILSPALLLPHDPNLNPKGVDYSKFRGEVLVIWGGQDNMMPAAQTWRFKNTLSNSRVQITTIDNAGHFVETDQPERVAEAMVDFMSRVVGVNNMGDICLGFKGIWKGDERAMISDLRRLWRIRP